MGTEMCRFVSLLCRSGDSCSVARHWVRPSVASLALLGVTGGSDPLSHRSPERSSGRQREAAGWRLVAAGVRPDVPPSLLGWQQRV